MSAVVQLCSAGINGFVQHVLGSEKPVTSVIIDRYAITLRNVSLGMCVCKEHTRPDLFDENGRKKNCCVWKKGERYFHACAFNILLYMPNKLINMKRDIRRFLEIADDFTKIYWRFMYRISRIEGTVICSAIKRI